MQLNNRLYRPNSLLPRNRTPKIMMNRTARAGISFPKKYISIFRLCLIPTTELISETVNDHGGKKSDDEEERRGGEEN